MDIPAAKTIKSSEPNAYDKQRLEAQGWSLVGQQRHKYGIIYYWDHPDHQPKSRGAFTMAQALLHQKKLNSGLRCNCVPKEFKLHE